MRIGESRSLRGILNSQFAILNSRKWWA
jgi:hypothetical protein